MLSAADRSNRRPLPVYLVGGSVWPSILMVASAMPHLAALAPIVQLSQNTLYTANSAKIKSAISASEDATTVLIYSLFLCQENWAPALYGP